MLIWREILRQYPDLRKGSNFFKATALLYGSMVKTGMPTVEALENDSEGSASHFARNGREGPAYKSSKERAAMPLPDSLPEWKVSTTKIGRAKEHLEAVATEIGNYPSDSEPSRSP